MIDVHAHYLPIPYLEELRDAGIKNVDGFPLPDWGLEQHLEANDAHAIQASVLSISAPGLRFARGAQARRLARRVNEAGRAIIDAHPTRFGVFAILPMDDVDAALAEMAFALDELGLDGVGLSTNYDGVYLGDPRFAPILDELHRRGAPIHVHPIQPLGFEAISLGFSAPMMEYPFDSTRMVVSLLATGTLDRLPGLRLIVSHGGGTLPFLWPRLARMIAGRIGPTEKIGLAKVRAQLQSLYYDLATVMHPGALAALTEMIPVSQMLIGFDYPFIPAKGIAAAYRSFRNFAGFDDEARKAIERGSADRLFPALAARIRGMR